MSSSETTVETVCAASGASCFIFCRAGRSYRMGKRKSLRFDAMRSTASQIEFATNANAATGGYYVQTVKIMKHWRDRMPAALVHPKSYVVETLRRGDDRDGSSDLACRGGGQGA